MRITNFKKTFEKAFLLVLSIFSGTSAVNIDEEDIEKPKEINGKFLFILIILLVLIVIVSYIAFLLIKKYWGIEI